MTKGARDILLYMRSRGSITALEALGVLNIYRLAARIFDLREAGVDIFTEHCHDPKGKPYARYWLPSAWKQERKLREKRPGVIQDGRRFGAHYRGGRRTGLHGSGVGVLQAAR